MKQGTPLKRYTPLQARSGFARVSSPLICKTSLKRSCGLKKRSDSDMIVLDGIFSEVVRRKHANSEGYVSCVTCWCVIHWKVAHAGHYKDRRWIMTRYDETNVFPQCEDCNCFLDKKEMLTLFEIFLTAHFGPEYPEFLDKKSRGDAHGFPYKTLIIQYTEERDKLRVLQDNEIQY